MAKPKLAPIDAKTFKQICSLSADNHETRDYWILLDEGVICLAKQRSGQDPTHEMRIPKRDFDKLVRWYMTGKSTR